MNACLLKWVKKLAIWVQKLAKVSEVSEEIWSWKKFDVEEIWRWKWAIFEFVVRFKTVLGSAYIAQWCLSCRVFSIKTLILTNFLGRFKPFKTKMYYFWGWGMVQKLFQGLTIWINKFCFQRKADFQLDFTFLKGWVAVWRFWL